MQSKCREKLSNVDSTTLSDLSYNYRMFFTPMDLQAYYCNPKNPIQSLSRRKWTMKIKNRVYTIVSQEAGKSGSENYT
jgi:hypothetical protein